MTRLTDLRTVVRNAHRARVDAQMMEQDEVRSDLGVLEGQVLLLYFDEKRAVEARGGDES